MNEELKNCPFCGGEAVILKRANTCYYPKCSKCYAMIDRICTTEEEAAGLWNRRTCTCKNREE